MEAKTLAAKDIVFSLIEISQRNFNPSFRKPVPIWHKKDLNLLHFDL